MNRRFVAKGYLIFANNLEEAKQTLQEYLNKPNCLFDSYVLDVVSYLKEIDYNKVYTYFPLNEILEEDKPFIYDYKRLNMDNPVVSLPLSLAKKYKTFIERDKNIKVPSIEFLHI